MLHTLRIQVNPVNPESNAIHQAVEILRAGGLVAFPTETVYGLGANGFSTVAVEKIYGAKGRPSNNPLILHVSSQEKALPLTTIWPETASKLAAKFWPGPLTLVLYKHALVPDIVCANGPTVAVRCPANPIAQALLNCLDFPLAAPSANPSTRLSPTTADHVWEFMQGKIDCLLDGGATNAGVESTVVDLTTNPPTLLRPGPLQYSQLEQVIGPIQVLETNHATTVLRSPGLLPLHYAPQTRLRWWDEKATLASNQTILDLGEDPQMAEQHLFAWLHDLDKRGFDCIWLKPIPETEAWAAIRDRLNRASQNH